MSQLIDVIPAEEEFDLDLVGTFGRFQAHSSFPVEYFQTSLRMSQAKGLLRFARDIEMDELNFDLLMQRDIDEKRVRDKIIPYLTQSLIGGLERPLFFPPLLVALVPVHNHEMCALYGNPEVVEPYDSFVGVRWKDNFRIYGKEVEGQKGSSLTPGISSRRFNSNQSVMSLRNGEAHETGVDLVVIDGQHRLRALKLLYEEQKDVVSSLDIPICVLYPPHSNLLNEHDQNVPTVPRVFRSLFVDVNSTMEVVGGHFTILLSDKNVGDIACRSLCDYVLEHEDRIGLAALEWNTRTKKNANNVTRAYSISTIGILNKALSDNFKPDMLLTYLLRITDSDDEIFQVKDDEDGKVSKIKWDRFSYAQSSVLSARTREEVAPVLHKLLFNTKPFVDALSIYRKHLQQLQKEKDAGGRSGTVASAILKHVLDYVPLPASSEEISLRFQSFSADVADELRQSGLELARKALFQRAALGVFNDFVRLGLRFQWDKSLAETSFLACISGVFSKDMNVFSPDNRYMQHTVYNEKNIITREETRRALKLLIMSHLLNKSIRESVVDSIELEDSDRNALHTELHSLAFEAAGNFIRIYRRERDKHFRKNYEFSYGIPREEREQLKLLEIKQSAMEQEVQSGERSGDSLDKEFDDAVAGYVAQDVLEIEDSLKANLGISVDIIEGIFDENDDQEEYEDEN